MIAKGNTHADGAKLARYMTKGKKGERAELWQLAGFAAGNIYDAFRDVHVMAAGTRCKSPFMHVQVRNPEGEALTQAQWLRVADHIEAKLGLSGQPRAIAFHTYDRNNDTHMHVAWSRIDEETLTAKPVRFFKLRLKEACRELEIELGITRVKNERESKIDFAPTRAEDQQARRLGVDIHSVRDTIRECYDRSDCGRAFEAALADKGFLLAQGDRRDFVVMDAQGGMYALGKRITGVSATKTRERFSDLVREQLPTVEQVRAHLAERQTEKSKQQAMPDQDREELRWQDAVAKAAIEKERVERCFVEPAEREGKGQGGREKEWPMRSPQAEQTKASAQYHREDVARPEPEPAPKKRKGLAAVILRAWNESETNKAFSAELERRGIAFARVTAEEAAGSHREAAFAKALGNYALRFEEGEIVAVTEPRPEYRRDGEIPLPPSRVHKLDQTDAETYLKAIKLLPTKLAGIEATKDILDKRAQDRRERWEAIRLENATREKSVPRNLVTKNKAFGIIARAAPSLASSVLGKALGGTAKIAEGIFAMFDPVLTPAQQKDKEIATREREANAADTIDLSCYLADRDQERRLQQERETPRQRERERDR